MYPVTVLADTVRLVAATGPCDGRAEGSVCQKWALVRADTCPAGKRPQKVLMCGMESVQVGKSALCQSQGRGRW